MDWLLKGKSFLEPESELAFETGARPEVVR
jgi:hypothetical protein